MDKSTIDFLSDFLSQTDAFVDFLSDRIVELLGMNCRDEKFKNFINESIRNSNFCCYEKTYLESLKEIVSTNLEASDHQVYDEEMKKFDALIEKMEQFKNANYTIEYDLISLANSLSRTFPLKFTRDDLFNHFKKREPHIIDFIKKYNEKIIDIIKTSIELEKNNQYEQMKENLEKQEEIKNNEIINDPFLKTLSQQEMIVKKQEQINKKQDKLQTQQEKLTDDVSKLNLRIDKLNNKIEKEIKPLEEEKPFVYQRLDVEIMKTNDLEKLLFLRDKIKTHILSDRDKDIMTKTSLKEDFNLVIQKIVTVATKTTKEVEQGLLPAEQNGIAQLIYYDKYFDILNDISECVNDIKLNKMLSITQDWEYLINYGLKIVKSSWINDFDDSNKAIDKYSILNKFMQDINKLHSHIGENEYNELVNLVESLRDSVITKNQNQKIIQPINVDKNN